MLKSLSITNMLLIEKAEIVFSSGLNVFTGETGAGKSIVFDCLGFVFGNKNRKSYLKENAKSGQVTVEFEIGKSSYIKKFLAEFSIPILETLIIRRVEFNDGKKKCYINDVNCTTDLLKKIGESLIEFVDQNNNSNLLKKQNHINLLDDFCLNKDKLNELKNIWACLKDEENKLSNLVKKKKRIFGRIRLHTKIIIRT
ncbi:MAG: AAA family ATPase [Paracoccaceae bacterium]